MKQRAHSTCSREGLVGGLSALLLLSVAMAYGQGPDRGEERLGSSLSVPVVFAEGHGVRGLATAEDTGLRPRPQEPTRSGTLHLDPGSIYVKDGITYYPQRTTSHWQADWRDGSGAEQVVIVNWSDNLVTQQSTIRSVIRVETELYQNLLSPMLAYSMAYLAGSGPGELWGTTGSPYDSFYATTYSVAARLRIQKIDGPGGDVVKGAQSFDDAVYGNFGVDGPGAYRAEVNAAGNLVYGYDWMLSQWDMATDEKLGWWRLTFALDPLAIYDVRPSGRARRHFEVSRNVRLAKVDAADVADEATFKPRIADPYNSVLEIEIVDYTEDGTKPESPGQNGGGGYR